MVEIAEGIQVRIARRAVAAVVKPETRTTRKMKSRRGRGARG